MVNEETQVRDYKDIMGQILNNIFGPSNYSRIVRRVEFCYPMLKVLNGIISRKSQFFVFVILLHV